MVTHLPPAGNDKYRPSRILRATGYSDHPTCRFVFGSSRRRRKNGRAAFLSLLNRFIKDRTLTHGRGEVLHEIQQAENGSAPGAGTAEPPGRAAPSVPFAQADKTILRKKGEEAGKHSASSPKPPENPLMRSQGHISSRTGGSRKAICPDPFFAWGSLPVAAGRYGLFIPASRPRADRCSRPGTSRPNTATRFRPCRCAGQSKDRVRTA